MDIHKNRSTGFYGTWSPVEKDGDLQNFSSALEKESRFFPARRSMGLPEQTFIFSVLK